MKLGILFAGQGSQKVLMGKDFYEASEVFRRVFDLLSDDLKKIAFEGPLDMLSETRNTQPIMAAFAAGVFNMLKAEGVEFSMAAGLSLGEYPALFSGGVFDEKTLIETVSLRGREMEKAACGVDCAMYAVMGMDRELLGEICREAGEIGIVNMVNFNCPGQIVISGEKEAVLKAVSLAKEKAVGRCVPLAVSGPFHTEFMKPVGEVLKDFFESKDFRPMEFPVVFNAVGREMEEGETVKDLLVKQVSSSVYFEDSIKYMAKHGVDTIVEIGPGKTLSSFVRKTDKSIKCLNIETLEDFKKVVKELKGEAHEG